MIHLIGFVLALAHLIVLFVSSAQCLICPEKGGGTPLASASGGRLARELIALCARAKSELKRAFFYTVLTRF